MKKPGVAFLQSPWRTLGYALSPWRGRIVTMFVLIGFGNICEYSLPYFLRVIVDDAMKAPVVHPFSLFLFPVVTIGALLLICEICFRIAHIGEVYISTAVFERITNDLYSRIIKRPTSYFEDKFFGGYR